ncbi:predicted diphthamide biosynthesis protein [Pseudozyma hubeiensis SY62]|uniref:Predicted diphthamide biosynthesis protein n=1 Tax=Pseudozyma hubeiensis (strain SY62) TaxID=1305764 RepID=R9P1A9_PSEHS|nr:predicted diphthamide biosynthesis protein [Pseudozyma hubeiensis SY62]GAC94944.1 predicted diphthamide biosynthesis protein [Pseudozyma hubeiensis SY62]
MAAFSTTDEAVLTAPLELNPLAQSATASSSGRPIYYIYDVVSTAAKIRTGRFKRVALQFPDEALIDSVPVYWALKSEVRKIYSHDAAGSDAASASTSTSALGSSTGLPEFYILADTSYGGCCVDEVAAKHVDADLVVHYGHACLSATARMPVIYVFTKQPLADVAAAASGLAQEASQHISSQVEEDNVKALVLTYDVSWDHVVDDVYHATQKALKGKSVDLPLVRTHVDVRRNYQDKLVNGKSSASSAAKQADCCGASRDSCCGGAEQILSSCCNGGGCSSQDAATCCTGAAATAPSPSSIGPPPSTTSTINDIASSQSSQPLGPSRMVTLPPGVTLSQCAYLYLGPESLSLTNLLLTLGASTPLISYNPLTSTSRVETGSTNRLLMKRYASVLKARDASVVGLLVGTLGVHSYLPLLKYLRQLLTGKKSGRKVYTISVGKLNPAKLANFQEIDVFVLVACPENTLVDSKEFYKPIVTPFEMELAVKAAERQQAGEEGVDWSGRYVLDLERLVPEEFKSEGGDLEAKMDGMKVEESGNVNEVDGDDDDDDDDDQPHFSLISGTYVHRRKFNTKPTTPALPSSEDVHLQLTTKPTGTGNQDRVVIRNPTTGELTTVLETASIAHLNKRGWKGLEQRLGMDEPSVLEEGREGIAKGYKDAGGQGEIM